MDYLRARRAMELPPIETVHLEYPSPRNPLGVKGVGEGGAISPPAAIANAVEDALAPFGVRVTRAPLGPSRVLGLIAEGAARLAGRGGRREARAIRVPRGPRARPRPWTCSARHGDDAKVLAGGQSLVPMLNLRLARPGVLVDINSAARSRLPARGGRRPRRRRARPPARARALGGRAAAAHRRGAPSGRSRGHPQPGHGGGQSRPRRSRFGARPRCCSVLDGAVVARREGGERSSRRPTSTSLRSQRRSPDEILAEARFTLPPAGAGLGLCRGRAAPRGLRPRRLRGAPVARRAGAHRGCANRLLRRRIDTGAWGCRRRPAPRSRTDTGSVAEAARAAAAALSPDETARDGRLSPTGSRGCWRSAR